MRSTIVLFFLSFICALPARADGRKTLAQQFHAWFYGNEPAANTSGNTANAFTLGTLLGYSYNMFRSGTYTLRDNVVLVDKDDSFSQRSAAGAFALPSVVIFDVSKDNKLSAILPFSASGGGVAGGIGVSLSIKSNVAQKIEMGLATAVVWQKATDLSFAQRQSLASGTPLRSTDPTSFDTTPKPALIVGVYITPNL